MKPFYNYFTTVLFFLFGSIFQNGYGQLVVNSGATPNQLVQNVLLGGGVTAYNVSYTGVGSMVGEFSNGYFTNLGLDAGVLLTTGNCTDVAQSSGIQMSTTHSASGDSDLDNLTSGGTFDASVLEFDFIPLDDTVEFRYVFGSEEYPEFVCSQFNDVFGFFISGPNPFGPAYNKNNIALIPSSSLPVAINSVNIGTPGGSYPGTGCTSLSYPMYFIDNLALGGTSIVFDGFTTVFTALCAVVPCQEYHIKLALADVGDGGWDSGVFLEANSFTSNAVTVTPTYSNSALGNNAVEGGCQDGIFAFTTALPATSPIVINYTISGTADNGVDYTSIPSSVTIQTGEDSVAIIISAFDDGIAEGTETITLSLTNFCSTIDYTIDIIDATPVFADAGADISLCSGNPANLSATQTSGVAPFSYSWDNGGGSNSTATFYPTITTDYAVTITDYCGQTDADTLTVNVTTTANISVTPLSDTICPGEPTTLSAMGGITYNWSPSTGLSSTSGSTVDASPLVNTTYTVTGTDAGGCTNVVSVNIDVRSITASTTHTSETCGQSNGTATAIPAGGCSQDYSYEWSTVPVQTTQTAVNLSAGTHTVTVSCGYCTVTATATIENFAGPSAAITSIENTTCTEANGSATVNAINGTPPYSYSWSCTPLQSTPVMDNVPAGSYTVTVSDHNNCIATNTVIIADAPGPSVNITNIIPEDCGFANGSLTAQASGGTPPIMYSWNVVPFQSDSIADNLSAGYYTIVITDSNNCEAQASAAVPMIGGPVATGTSTPEYCDKKDGSATVTITGGSSNYTYLWNTIPAQTTATATNLSQGIYTVTVSDGGCSTKSTIVVDEVPGPTAEFNAHPRILTVLDSRVVFSDYSQPSNIDSWYWNFGDNTIDSSQNPIHTYEGIGEYPVVLIVTDTNGCSDTISDTITVKDIFNISIPNAFTPNEDGKNDYFAVWAINVNPNEFQMAIYDRWGNLVFETDKWYDDHSEYWNGTLNNNGRPQEVLMDVYVYTITLREIAGSKHLYTGRITVIR